MKITDSNYEGVIEHSYKKPTVEDASRAGHSRKNRGETALSWTCPEKGERSYKHIKRFVDSPTGKTKIYLIHGPGNSSEEWKVLGDFGTNYAKSRPTKDHRKIPIPRKSVNR